MDNQAAPSTEFTPVIPPATQGTAGPPHQKPKVWIYLIAVILLIFTVYMVFGMIRASTNQEPAQTTAPTPTVMVTPTAAPLSQITQQSAFTEFQSNVATLSAAIAAFTANDPTLAPPTLVLPLGFTE